MGFQHLTPEQRRAVSAKGGAAQPPEKRGFSVNRELASEAGKIGGKLSKGGKRKAVSDD